MTTSWKSWFNRSQMYNLNVWMQLFLFECRLLYLKINRNWTIVHFNLYYYSNVVKRLVERMFSLRKTIQTNLYWNKCKWIKTNQELVNQNWTDLWNLCQYQALIKCLPYLPRQQFSILDMKWKKTQINW